MPYKVPLLRPSRERGADTASILILFGSPDSWISEQRAGESTELHCDCDIVVGARGIITTF